MSNRGNRGGKREGSGRKKGQGLKFGEATRIMRVPESVADKLDELIALKNDVNAATQELRETNEYLQRELEAMRQELEAMNSIQTERDELKQWQEKFKPQLIRCRQLRDDLYAIQAELMKPDKDSKYPRGNHSRLKKDILDLVGDNKGAEPEE